MPTKSCPRSPFQLATAGNTSEGASVTRVCANSSTCVPNVMHPTHPAQLQLLQALTGYDQAEVNFLVDGFINGFKINYIGNPSLLSTHNHPSALDHKDVVEQKRFKELSPGRIAGPFISPPFTHYQSSPLGLVAKKEPNAFRLIHDLSYPQGNSINECIPKDFTAVSYETLDHVHWWVRPTSRMPFASFPSTRLAIICSVSHEILIFSTTVACQWDVLNLAAFFKD